MALTRVHTDLIEGSLGEGVAEELQVDTFVGDGTTKTFELTRLPDHVSNTQVYISGVYQQKSTYIITGLDLIFSEAPALGESIEAVVAYVNPSVEPRHGGGLYMGNNGTVGDSMAAGDMIRVNSQTLLFDVTVGGDQNASCAGPITVDTGVVLTVIAGGNFSVV